MLVFCGVTRRKKPNYSWSNQAQFVFHHFFFLAARETRLGSSSIAASTVDIRFLLPQPSYLKVAVFVWEKFRMIIPQLVYNGDTLYLPYNFWYIMAIYKPYNVESLKMGNVYTPSRKSLKSLNKLCKVKQF